MKFLVDAQLPKALADLLNSKGHNTIHTLDLPKKNQTKDSEISSYADAEGRIIISKDTDFLESLMVNNRPNKLILVTTGNIQNKLLLQIFEKNLELITQSLSRSRVVELGKNTITEYQ